MDELIAFITARLDEDEAVLDASDADNGYHRFMDADSLTEKVVGTFADEDRCRREIAAKRQLIANHEATRKISGDDDEYVAGLDAALYCIGVAWADHPDYQQEWRPQ